ncbi:tellurite resistance TerB family protein [Altibacter sp. HG106]|uniref:tellurite resistance TerB family protein n=1 Tax=Altibacter sp. HG106 TaxID=3023937 RepID=UPI0023507B5C|nr:TerB family tellurite resistance protein [Altibacter sp. HG106]MDC7993978.1 TerB family tellurite resistance protein [Altibacter sp. HG106]
MEQQKKFGLLSDLIALAFADNTLKNEEYDFILRMAKRMDVSEKEVEHLLEHPVPSPPIPNEMDRIIHFHKMVLLMNVDYEVHESEVQLLREFGIKLGIRPGAVDRILNRTQELEDRVIPAQELMGIFKTYYN